jgi:hypothetical protein
VGILRTTPIGVGMLGLNLRLGLWMGTLGRVLLHSGAPQGGEFLRMPLFKEGECPTHRPSLVLLCLLLALWSSRRVRHGAHLQEWNPRLVLSLQLLQLLLLPFLLATSVVLLQQQLWELGTPT